MNECLIEQLIIGTKYMEVQERFLGKDEKITLDASRDVARTHEVTHEATESHMNMMKAVGNHKMNVDAV